MSYKEVKNKGTKTITLRDYSEVALFTVLSPPSWAKILGCFREISFSLPYQLTFIPIKDLYESSDDDIYEPDEESSDDEMPVQANPGPSNLAEAQR